MMRRRRDQSQGGYVLILALVTMLVVMLTLAAVFNAVQSDAGLTAASLNGERAYSAAQAGLQAYLGQLNKNAAASNWWQTCSNDSASNVAVPGNTGESYSYQPVVNQSDSTTYCANSSALGTVVDPSVGLLRMEFTGYAGTGAQRTIVADFRPQTPLAYLWYTVHETANPAIVPGCPSNNTTFYSNSTVPSSCWIYWANGDTVNGPMYTQDQFLVASGATPKFGRASSNDAIASPNSSLCVVDNGGSQPVADPASTDPSTCPSGIIQGKADPNAATIPLPADNSNLATDAGSYGVTLPQGTTTLTLSTSGSGSSTVTTGTAVTCTSSASSSCQTNTYNLTSKPIVYAPNQSGCTASASSYNPAVTTYSQISGGTYNGDFYGICGDLYVHGTYGTSLTLAAGNSIVVTGNLLNSTDPNGSTTPTGSATLGLVANSYVRVYHPTTFQYNSQGQATSCSGSSSNMTIDAAILALTNSFYVDNYDCDSPGTLTVHGSIAQEYRGAVATANSSGGVGTGYQKNYVYDDRLKVILPAYMFDLQNTSWDTVRETLCSSGQPSTAYQSCAYTGNAG